MPKQRPFHAPSSPARFIPGRTVVPGIGVGYDVDAVAWFAAIASNGGTIGGTAQRVYSDFFKGLKGDGLWTLIAQMHCAIGLDNAAAVAVKAKHPAGVARVTPVTGAALGAGDLNATGADAGYRFNGVDRWWDSGFIPSTHGADVSSFHMAASVKGIEAGGSARSIIFGSSGSSITGLGWFMTGTREVGCIAAASSTEYSPSPGTTSLQGMLLTTVAASRTQRFYDDGVEVQTPVAATGAATSLPLYIGAGNQTGTPSFFSTRRLRVLSIGTGMSAAQVTLYKARLSTLHAAFGATLEL